MLVPLGKPDGRTAWNVTAADGRELAVFVVDGACHVTAARCPHNKGPLAEGTIRDGTTLVCPWHRHRFRFDLRTGECANLRMYDLRVYPVVRRDGHGSPTSAKLPRSSARARTPAARADYT